ncbi:glycosyltransferase [Zunongwangia sp. HRR-M8]|uniref:glycosyltransferase n=1 Tax=Zunongwangia sp. HRR-M8 TaxID=3015170 RepID=UPI0022DD75EA|nr:glycosyltransferase [Zunongwangia sp. HRR-M8]WBL21653.1 glycosyltransferase [Zunongwangia sp. HRR-M8]
MRILHIVDRMDPKAGGVCQAIRMIIESLKHRNVESDVVSVDDPKMRFQDDFKILAFGPAENPWQYSKKLLPWLICNLGNYDTVIIHGLWQYYSFATYKALKERNGEKPVVFVMPHGMLDPYFQNAPDRKLKAIRNKIYWQIIERHVINGCDALLFTCKTELDLAKLPFKPYKPKIEKVIGLGIKAPPRCTTSMVNAFYDKTGLTNSDDFLLFLGRINRKKGLDLLVKAFLQLLDNIQMPKLVIAGPGINSDFGLEIINLIKTRPELKSYFIFPGMLTGDLKWGAFYACEAFILPSHQENFGIATVEALACRKPVLISNQVNIHNEIVAFEAGLVEEDNLEGVLNLLSKWMIISNKNKEMMTYNAEKCFKELFQYQSIANKIIELNNSMNEKYFEYSVEG